MTETPQPPAQAAPAPPAEKPKGNGMATAGMVLGIISAGLLLLWCFPFPAVVVGVIGLVLSLLGTKKANQLNGVGAGKAKVGLILSIIGIAGGILEIIFWVAAAKTASDKFMQDMQNMQRSMPPPPTQ